MGIGDFAVKANVLAVETKDATFSLPSHDAITA